MSIATAAVRPDQTRRHPTARRVGWVIMTVFSVIIGGYAVALVASGFRLVPEEIAANRFPTPLGLRVHIVASGLALLVGPFQFARALRRPAAPAAPVAGADLRDRLRRRRGLGWVDRDVLQ